MNGKVPGFGQRSVQYYVGESTPESASFRSGPRPVQTWPEAGEKSSNLLQNAVQNTEAKAFLWSTV